MSEQRPSSLISVIMPCYNAAVHLSKSVESVVSQTFSNWELIAVDDGSSDNTLAWLHAHAEPRLRIHSQANRGVSAARNAGLKLAQGEYIAFLDSDDTWEPNFLEKMLAALQANPKIALAYCGWKNLGVSGGRGEPYIPPDYESPEKIPDLIKGCRWPIHATLTRSQYIKAIGGFNESFTIGEDFLLWMEIGCFHPIVRVPEVLVYYHHHGGVQATKNRILAAKETWKAQNFFVNSHPEIIVQQGKQQIRKLIHGSLLKKGYEYYWQRDLETAREIFRIVMRSGYGSTRDWIYMLPSLLPRSVHSGLLKIFSKNESGSGMTNP